MDHHANDDRCVERDPADAGKVDRLVALLDSVNEPQTGGEQVRCPCQILRAVATRQETRRLPVGGWNTAGSGAVAAGPSPLAAACS